MYKKIILLLLCLLLPATANGQSFSDGQAIDTISAHYDAFPVSGCQGQFITFTYSIENAGGDLMERVSIANPGVSSAQLDFGTIEPGKTKLMAQTVQLDSEPLISDPSISFTLEGNASPLVYADLQRYTVEPAHHGLVINLYAPEGFPENPGASVKLICVIENVGTESYKNLRIEEHVLGELFEVDSLDSGDRHEENVVFQAAENMEIAFQLTAYNNTGDSEVVQFSNVLYLLHDEISAAP